MVRFHISKENPQPRSIRKAAELVRAGGLAIYPTDTTYGLGCDLYSKRSMDRIYSLKGMNKKQPLSFMCADLSEVARYAIVEDRNYRILRQVLPGKYTFILPASREVPKIVQSKRRHVGIRIPDNAAALALIRELGHPLITTTAAREVEGEVSYSNDPDEIAKVFGRSIDVFLDAGALYDGPSTIVDLTGDSPVVIRQGSGSTDWIH